MRSARRLWRFSHLALFVAAACGFAVASWGHGGDTEVHGRDGSWWMLWNLRPSVLLILGAVTALYFLGVRRLWSRAGRGRGISVRQTAVFSAGIGALVLALISPIDVIAEELNSVHMIQHMLLIMVAAPLLILGSSGQALIWIAPRRVRSAISAAYAGLRRAGIRRYILWQPMVMWATFALVLWLLHIPELYQAALHNRFLHDLQHIAFLVAACLFWRVLLDPISTLRLNPALGVLYLFSTTLQAGALGVFMAFSPRLWYPDYAATTAVWQVDALQDQQLAGYIMWMPACLIYAIAAAVIFGLWLRDPPNASRPRSIH